MTSSAGRNAAGRQPAAGSRRPQCALGPRFCASGGAGSAVIGGADAKSGGRAGGGLGRRAAGGGGGVGAEVEAAGGADGAQADGAGVGAGGEERGEGRVGGRGVVVGEHFGGEEDGCCGHLGGGVLEGFCAAGGELGKEGGGWGERLLSVVWGGFEENVGEIRGCEQTGQYQK
jgi:hypothetical protein